MHPYYPPGAASSQIYSCGLHMMIFCLSLSHTFIAYPPIYPPAPSQMDSCGFILLIFLLIIVTQYAASSYSSRSSGEPSESSEEPLVEELGDPDKSEALFSMYLDRSDEDDRKTTERWKGECDAILIFVSMHPCFRVPLFSTLLYRLVFFRPHLLLFFPSPSRASSRIHRTPRRSISEIFIIS